MYPPERPWLVANQILPKLYLLSDLVLHALAFFGSRLVRRKAIAGRYVLIDRTKANQLLYGEAVDPEPRNIFEEGTMYFWET